MLRHAGARRWAFNHAVAVYRHQRVEYLSEQAAAAEACRPAVAVRQPGFQDVNSAYNQWKAGRVAELPRWWIEGARTSDLERLRRGPTRVSGKAMVAALDRVSEIAGLGVGGIDLGAVPRRRVVELARYGMTGKAPALRRHPYARRLATLLTAVVDLQAKATDDALELFDVLMTNDLLARA